MSSPKKWRIVYLDGESMSSLENRIVSEFKRIYAANNEPERMALFSHYTHPGVALSITPQSVPFCASLPFFDRWEESGDTREYGNVRWHAGDKRIQ